jgi:general secretion pathway protein L
MNLSTNVDLGRLMDAVAAPFFGWLKRELAAFVPEPLRRLGARRGEALIAFCDGRALRVTRRSKNGPEIDAVMPLEELVRAEQIVGVGERARRLPLVLRFPRQQGLSRIVTLPRAAAENLRRILQLEMDRNTPWRGDQVYFDAEIVGRDDRTISTRLAVLPKAAADPVLTALRDVGLSPAAMDLAGDDPRAPATLNLLGPATRAAPSRSRRALWYGLSGTAAAALLLSFGFGLYDRYETLSELQQRLETGRTEAEVASRLGNQLVTQRKEASYLLERKRTTPSIISVMETLSDKLPDTVWLNELKISQGEMQILGYAKDASSLVPTLEGSGSFARATHRSPIVSNASAGVEHFHIAASIQTTPAAAR